MNTLKLKSNFDDLSLGVAFLPAQGTPKAIFQIVHGMAEHKERYYPFMEFLSEHGYACVIHDHRGHGESVKSEQDLGFMYDGGADAMVEDVLLVQSWAKGQFPNLPVYLFGHSMGSMVVRAFTRKYDDRIDKLIVCGCPSNNPGKGVGIGLASIIGVLCGSKHRSRLLNQLAFGGYGKLFEEGNPLAWLSANKANVADYHRDPLCGFIFTANGFKNLFKIMKQCYAAKGWKMSKPSLPIMFISGGDDPCRISNKDFMSAVNFMKDRGYKDVTYQLYPGLRHEILLEGEKQVWDDVLEFIEK